MSVFSQVIGKFSIRIVPDQTPEVVESGEAHCPVSGEEVEPAEDDKQDEDLV